MSPKAEAAALEARMRALETRQRVTLDAHAFTVVRLDGRGFTAFTRGLVKPFDPALTDALLDGARALCVVAQGARLAYVQSDEVSLVLSDLDAANAQPWFGGNQQKVVSVCASVLTATFARAFVDPRGDAYAATFDARAFTLLPGDDGPLDYLRWRQADAVRNSISAAAHAVLPHRATVGRPTHELRALLLERGVDWLDYHPFHRRGAFVYPERVVGDVEYVDRRTNTRSVATNVRRWRWETDAFDLRDAEAVALLRRKLTRSTTDDEEAPDD